MMVSLPRKAGSSGMDIRSGAGTHSTLPCGSTDSPKNGSTVVCVAQLRARDSEAA